MKVTLVLHANAAELVIGALRKLPHEQVHDLVMDLFTQFQQQLSAPPPAEQAEATEEE